MRRNNVVVPVVGIVLVLAVIVIWMISTTSLPINKLSALSKIRCYTNTSLAEQSHQPQAQTPAKVSFTVSAGQSLEEIASGLKKADVIGDADYLVCYLKKTNLDSTIQAGYFELPTNASQAAIATALQNASVPSITVTIPEGLMLPEIADILDSKFTDQDKKFSKGEFLALTTDKEFIKTVSFVHNQTTLEGYLYPDTYSFERGATAKDVIAVMLQNFESKVLDAYRKEINNSSYSLEQIVTLASLVEREERNPEQKKMVADIIERRLKAGWNLGIDATLLYYFKDWEHVITAQDVLINSPYNTRNRAGLPPSAICNPGLDSIKAVLFPEPNTYWYYLHGKDGKIHYARTNAEHEANKAKYL